jgi:putative acetyltransferase
MTSSARLCSASTEQEWKAARVLIEEYAASLGVDLCFQDFGEEIEHLPAHYGPPRGVMLLAMDGDKAIGCVGLREHNRTTGEVKRLYVAPSERGRALGRALAVAVIDVARALGYRRLVLDTLPSMAAAQALYASLGFQPIDAYRYNPVRGAVYMALDLA